jgi:hypothetical protein
VNSSRRAAPRVEINTRAALFVGDTSARCVVVNLSSDGALIGSELEVEPGAHVGLGIHLFEDLRKAAGLDYLHFELEVLERSETDGGGFQYRCKNLTRAGSPAHERAVRVVTAADFSEPQARKWWQR